MDEKVLQYLKRIGFSGDITPSKELLGALQKCHIESVPYENLDILAGIPLNLDPAALFEKVVTKHRGGFCFELNALFSWLLRTLGFDVTDCFARYLLDEAEIPMRRHHVLLIRLNGEKLLCDVGVGGESPRHPLLLQENLIQNDGFTSYVFERDDFLGWVLCQQRSAERRKHYSFTEEQQLAVDFAATNFYCEKHPLSPFNKGNMIAIKTPTGRKTIDKSVFKVFDGQDVRVTEMETASQIADVLRGEFGLVQA